MNSRKVAKPCGEKIKFPIEMSIVNQGVAKTKYINYGEIAKCWWCGKDIIVDGETAFVYKGNMYIKCPDEKCGKVVSAYYYMGKTEKGEDAENV